MNTDFNELKQTMNGAAYYIDTMLENTPYFGQITLYVVNKRQVDEVLYVLEQHPLVTHLYIGANSSFTRSGNFSEMVKAGLSYGYNVSLAFCPEHYNLVKDEMGDDYYHHKFCPIVNLHINDFEEQPNTCIQINDMEFGGNNGGVYAMRLSECLDANRFTPWNDYHAINVVETRASLQVKRMDKRYKAKLDDAAEARKNKK